MRTPAQCDHESVRITRIAQGRTGNKATRTIGGRCEKCFAPVTRMQTLLEFKTGIPSSWWKSWVGA